MARRAIARMTLPEPVARHRYSLAVVAGLGIVFNRTFLAWLSSGLETAMFNFFFLWWFHEATAPDERRDGTSIGRLTASAVLAALSRPDGLLAVAATVAVVAHAVLRRRVSWRSAAAWSTPLLAIVAHLIWRRATYGDWLPNTDYAKYLAPWPEAGAR